MSNATIEGEVQRVITGTRDAGPRIGGTLRTAVAGVGERGRRVFSAKVDGTFAEAWGRIEIGYEHYSPNSFHKPYKQMNQRSSWEYLGSSTSRERRPYSKTGSKNNEDKRFFENGTQYRQLYRSFLQRPGLRTGDLSGRLLPNSEGNEAILEFQRGEVFFTRTSETVGRDWCGIYINGRFVLSSIRVFT